MTSASLSGEEKEYVSWANSCTKVQCLCFEREDVGLKDRNSKEGESAVVGQNEYGSPSVFHLQNEVRLIGADYLVQFLNENLCQETSDFCVIIIF